MKANEERLQCNLTLPPTTDCRRFCELLNISLTFQRFGQDSSTNERPGCSDTNATTEGYSTGAPTEGSAVVRL